MTRRKDRRTNKHLDVKPRNPAMANAFINAGYQKGNSNDKAKNKRTK